MSAGDVWPVSQDRSLFGGGHRSPRCEAWPQELNFSAMTICVSSLVACASSELQA